MAQASERLTKQFPFSCKSMEVNLSLDELRPYLSEEEHTRVASIKSKSLALQKAHAYYLIKKLIGGDSTEISVGYSGNGRPYINNKDMDISISHKENIVYAGMAPSPYKIGVDIELLNQVVDVGILKSHFLNVGEVLFLKKYSIRHNLQVSSAFIIFWSIKESFFKCLGHSFKPKEICIKNISDKGEVILSCSKRVKELMKMFTLELVEIIFNQKYVYARTLIKKNL